MIEITTVLLENEMDLILANKQSMKLAELSGFSISSQTTFATAVSEVARTAIERTTNAMLSLCISGKQERPKYIIAVIKDEPGKLTSRQKEGYAYARRLVSDMAVINGDDNTTIELRFTIPTTTRVDDVLVERMRTHLNTDPEVSPYEEIKRKNRQLLELSVIITRSERQFRDLTDSLPLLIYTINPAGKILYGNKWLQDYTGHTVDELNETHWGDVLTPDDKPGAWATFAGHNSTKKQFKHQRLLKSAAEGIYKWHAGVSTPVLDDKDELLYWHVFMADIHAQKTIEEALKDNKELKAIQAKLEEKVNELNNSNRELEQFAYVASHDLQEPLRKISFYTDVLRKKIGEQQAADVTALFQNIQASANHMRALIYDVLAYSTINTAEEKHQPVNLDEVAAETLQDLEMTIAEKAAKIHVDPLPSVPGNAVQLRQLFGNLLANSMKYVSPAVTPEVTITATIKGKKAEIRFKDNGIGFDTTYLDRMFHLFQRLHGRDKFSGTGIGLAICKKVVQLHGGAITAESKPGEGAEFIITLPVLTA